MTTLSFNPFNNLGEQIEYGALANSCGFGQDESKSSFRCIAEKFFAQQQEIQLLKNENKMISRSLQISVETLQTTKTRLGEEIQGRCQDICSAATKYRDDMIAKENEIETLRHETHPFPLTPDNSRINHVEQDLLWQEDFKTESLYWGANSGHVTIWRLPEDLTIPDDMDFGDVFGNSRCLGEEWGGLNSVCIKTVTQEMIDAERFE
jgi:hypothetical protein